MVARLTILTVAALASLGLTAAQAADYPQPLPQPIIIEQPAPEFASGWYLRGDIGFSNQEVRSLYNDNYALYSQVINTDKGFDSAPFFGLGIGYNFNSWLRFDVTGEYRGKANFHGYDRAQDSSGVWYDDNYSGSKSEWTFLANAYVDLGTWYCLTPFVGAGIGMSRNTISSFRDIGVRATSDVYGDTASKWSFAWALYAGVGYQVTKNVTIELAYRYINLGDAVTGDLHGYDGSPDISYTPYTFNHLTSHDIKLGLRFNLDSGYEQPTPVRYYAPPPVYTAPPIYAPPPPLRSRG